MESELYASVVLAFTPTPLYLLGRHKIGPLASYANMILVAEILREYLRTELKQHGIVRNLTRFDEQSGKEYNYEVKALGSATDDVLDELNDSDE